MSDLIGARPARAALVVNRRARGASRFAAARDRLVSLGVPVVEARLVDGAEEVAQASGQFVASGLDLVVVGGGDGTLSLVASTLRGTPATLGVLPLGTANDFARTLEIPSDLDAACEVVARGTLVDIDVGVVGTATFLNVASLGLGAEIAPSSRTKRLLGPMAYPAAVAQHSLTTRPFRLAMAFPDDEHPDVEFDRVLHLAVGNGRYYGGGRAVSATAGIDDGVLDVYVVLAGSPLALGRTATRLRSGDFRDLSTVRSFRASTVVLDVDGPVSLNLDGEMTEAESPLRFSVDRNALRVIGPASSTRTRLDGTGPGVVADRASSEDWVPSMGLTAPGLVAGPIVRRAESGRVDVWAATTEPSEVALEVHRAGAEADGPIGSGPARMVRLGARLYVHLASATPFDGAFPQDEILSYDLTFVHASGSLRLGDLGLLDGPGSLALPGFDLPTLLLRDQVGPVHVLHGSCRKLQGKGEEALQNADDLLTATAASPEQRPSALFLSGDQIYGDDVSDAAILHLHRLARYLTGGEEEVPGIPPLQQIPVDRRSSWIRGQVGFTSSHSANHLMSFGEYAAAHLLALSDACWPEDVDDLPQPVPAGLRVARPVQERRLASHLGDLERARRSLPAVRRVLANIATYAIFDDHDVTDDWNISASWRERVHASASGRRIVANALAAFWAFLAWGNDRDVFDDEFIEALEAQVSAEPDVGAVAGVSGAASVAPELAARFDAAMWGFDRWSFIAPVGPPVVCLDTRTQRGYDSPEGAARLIARAGFDRAAELVAASGHRPDQPLFVVTATPVCGLELHERSQKLVAAQVGPYLVDFEGWHSNLAGLVDLMRFFAVELEQREVVVLSGDVHYGMTVDYHFEIEGRELHIAQVVSSGLKHSGRITRKALSMVGELIRKHHQRVGWGGPPTSTNGSAFDRRRLAAAVNTDEWSDCGPVFCSPRLRDRLGIEATPDFRESRTYLHPDGPSHSPLIGENNIGSVIFDGRRLRHVVRSRGTHATIHEASIDLSSCALDDPGSAHTTT